MIKKYFLYVETSIGFLHPIEFTNEDEAIAAAEGHDVDGEEAFCVMDENKIVVWSLNRPDFDSRIIGLQS